VSEQHQTGTRRLNILLIMCDQLRLDALGCYGNTVVETPNIDALAREGVRFDNMFAAYPVCAPNRASIVTGRYPSVHRLRTNGQRLPLSELTLMEILRREGYATYGAGKMHFGPQWAWPADGSPIKDPDPSTAISPQPGKDAYPWYGFHRAALTEDHRMGPYGDYLTERGYNVWDELHSASYPQSATVRSPFPEEHHQTTWITDRAIEFLDEHPADRPFFLWVSYVHPHHPFNPPAPYDTMYDPAVMPLPQWDAGEIERWPEAYQKKFYARSGSHEAVGLCDFQDRDWQRIKAYYYGMISQIDANVGRLLEVLRTRGALDNTLVVFTTDHGENLGDHRLLFKGTTYDCVTRVPFVVCPGSGSLPGKAEPGSRRDQLCSSIDVLPTLLDLLGVAQPDPSPIQGQSLAPALIDANHRLRESVLIENGGIRRSVRTRDALLTWHGPDTRGELYDLSADPECFVNLWDEPSAAELRLELLHTLIQLMAENVDPLPIKEGPW
jgi:arylsulfatase A-like enzyme